MRVHSLSTIQEALLFSDDLQLTDAIIFGLGLTYLLERWSDKSRPAVAIVRVGTVTSVPDFAEEILVQFPSELATQLNAHPAVPFDVDATKDIALPDYAKQVKAIREAVRVTLTQHRFGKEVIDRLFRALDRDDHVGFFSQFASNYRFLLGWLFGRTTRGETPPVVPATETECASIHPRSDIAVKTDADGDYLVDRVGSAAVIPLIWSSIKGTERERCKRMAGEFAAAISEFRKDYLRPVLGAIARDVEGTIEHLSTTLERIRTEETSYSFLAVSVLCRNAGRRPYCVSNDARLFIEASGYTFATPAGEQRAIPEDIVIDLVTASNDDNQGVTNINPGEARIVQFVSRGPLSRMGESEAIRLLGTAGERGCYLGLRLFRENRDAENTYTETLRFRVLESQAPVPPRDAAPVLEGG